MSDAQHMALWRDNDSLGPTFGIFTASLNDDERRGIRPGKFLQNWQVILCAGLLNGEYQSDDLLPAKKVIQKRAQVHSGLRRITKFPPLTRLAPEEGVGVIVVGELARFHVEGELLANFQSDDSSKNDFGESSGVVEIAARCGSALVLHRTNPVAGVTRNAGDGFLRLLD